MMFGAGDGAGAAAGAGGGDEDEPIGRVICLQGPRTGAGIRLLEVPARGQVGIGVTVGALVPGGTVVPPSQFEAPIRNRAAINKPPSHTARWGRRVSIKCSSSSNAGGPRQVLADPGPGLPPRNPRPNYSISPS